MSTLGHSFTPLGRVSTEVGDEAKALIQNEQFFIPKYVQAVRKCVPMVRDWDESIYMNSAGFVLVPPVVLFFQLPLVFILTFFFGWIIAVRVFLERVRTSGLLTADGERFISPFALVFFGSAAPLIQGILKLVVLKWHAEDLPRDLWGLWTTNTLSGVELLAPFLAPLVVSSMSTFYAYEFALAKSGAYDIGDEFDELGFFPRTMQDMREFFRDLHDKVRDTDNEKIVRFFQVPYVETLSVDDFKFADHGTEYCENWANRQAGQYHPLYVFPIAKCSCTGIILTVLSLAPAVSPFIWMKLTHPDEYLASPLWTVKVSAFVSCICIFMMAWKVLQFWWTVWTDFVMIRCHLLAILYICASEAGRRYVHRLWRFDIDRLLICADDSAQDFGRPTKLTQYMRRQTAIIEAALPEEDWEEPSPLISKNETVESQEPLADELMYGRQITHLQTLTDNHDPFRDLVMMCRKPAFPRKPDKHGEVLSEQSSELPIDKEEELELWLDKNKFRNFHVLDIEKFTWVRGCMKPNIMLARVRLESCLVGSAFITVVSATVVLIDYQTPPVGILSCVGIMALWLFIICAIFVIVCINSAIMMNMALMDSSAEVLQHWKTRIRMVAIKAAGFKKSELSKTFSNYRVQLDSKFRNLQDQFDYRLAMIKEERPLQFAFIPTTPAWRNRLIVSMIGGLVIMTLKLAWAWVTGSLENFHDQHFDDSSDL